MISTFVLIFKKVNHSILSNRKNIIHIVCELEPDERRSTVRIWIISLRLPDFYGHNLYAPKSFDLNWSLYSGEGTKWYIDIQNNIANLLRSKAQNITTITSFVSQKICEVVLNYDWRLLL